MISLSECNAWFAVFLIESVAIVTMNLLSIILFMKNSNLRTRGMYLVINLTAADMLVGGFSIIGLLLFLGTGCGSETNTRSTSGMYITSVFVFYWFPMTSLTNIAVISLDRLHATFLLFRHRVIQTWVYWVTAVCVWVSAAMVSTLIVTWQVNLLGKEWTHFLFLWQSYCCLCLFVICVSYASIVVKFLCGTYPQQQGAANRQKKLTVTLFIMTIVWLLIWLPFALGSFVYLTSNSIYSLYYLKHLNAQYALLVLSYANSLVNPFIYTIRMPEFRKALLILFKLRQKQDAAMIRLQAH